jgi:hypothetical protein
MALREKRCTQVCSKDLLHLRNFLHFRQNLEKRLQGELAWIVRSWRKQQVRYASWLDALRT